MNENFLFLSLFLTSMHHRSLLLITDYHHLPCLRYFSLRVLFFASSYKCTACYQQADHHKADNCHEHWVSYHSRFSMYLKLFSIGVHSVLVARPVWYYMFLTSYLFELHHLFPMYQML